MILSGLFAWFMTLFEVLNPIVISDLDVIVGNFDYAVDLVCDGVALLGLFIGDIGLYSISVYLVFVLALELFYLVYQIIWFVLKKVPMINVDQ